jgi:hypothetical protein
MLGVMPFGKYRGLEFKYIDGEYLMWLLSLQDLKLNLRRRVFYELRSRGVPLEPGLEFAGPGREAPFESAPPAPNAAPAIDLAQIAARWRRQMAAEYHPDIGGNHEAMLVVERGWELLKQIVNDAAKKA